MDNILMLRIFKNTSSFIGFFKRKLNFIEGTNITLTVSENVDDKRIDVTINSSAGGGVSDGDKGDITVSGSGTVWTIDAGSVGDSKIASGITASKITEDSTHRFATDSEKTTWNNKLDTNGNGSALTGLTKNQVGLSNVDNTSDVNKPISTATQAALDGKVDENTAITGATKTKITYDAKGLITNGTDATTADIADSTNKRYVTDAQLTVIGNTSGTNTGDQDISGKQNISEKDASGGYAGLTLLKINFKNVANTFTSFFTNSFIAATDFLLVKHISATNGGAWNFSCVCSAGSATINIRNVSSASITEATPLRFTIIKGVTA